MLRPPPARGPPAPVHPYRIRAPLRFAGRSAALPPTRCRLPQWVQAPGRTTPRPTVHCCQPLLAVLVGSGTGQVCSTPPHAPGRTRSDSIRSIRTPRLPVQPLAGSAGAVLRKPVLHSCPYFITKIIARTDGFLGRLPSDENNPNKVIRDGVARRSPNRPSASIAATRRSFS